MIIYKILNKINGRIYIGQTKKDLSQRIATHIKINRYYVQKALNKYGLESFEISVIDEAASQDVLDEKEKYWIKYYGCKAPCGYNCTDGGDGTHGYEPTDEVRKKNSLSHTGKKTSFKTRQKMSLAQKGKRLSKEHKQKLSVAKTGKLFSEEHKRKLSESHKGKQPKLGTHHSEATLIKMRGKVISEEHKQRLREVNLGKRLSEEAKQKIRNSRIGTKASPETKENLRAAWVIRKQKAAT